MILSDIKLSTFSSNAAKTTPWLACNAEDIALSATAKLSLVCAVLRICRRKAYQVSLTAQASVIPVIICGTGIQWSRLIDKSFADDSPVLDCPPWPEGDAHEYTPILQTTFPSDACTSSAVAIQYIYPDPRSEAWSCTWVIQSQPKSLTKKPRDHHCEQALTYATVPRLLHVAQLGVCPLTSGLKPDNSNAVCAQVS